MEWIRLPTITLPKLDARQVPVQFSEACRAAAAATQAFAAKIAAAKRPH